MSINIAELIQIIKEQQAAGIDPLLSPRDVAELRLLGVTSAAALSKMRSDGKGPKYTRLSQGGQGKVFYKMSAITEWQKNLPSYQHTAEELTSLVNP